jgi:cell division protease FtsH
MFLLSRRPSHRDPHLLAGRVGRGISVFDTKTSGAANDIVRATDLARMMVTMFGMTDKFGMMGLATVQNQYLDGAMGLTCAQATAAEIDLEIRAIIDACHDDARRILTENREKLDEIAGYLLRKETITGSEMMAILDGSDPALAESYDAQELSPPLPAAIPLDGSGQRDAPCKPGT